MAYFRFTDAILKGRTIDVYNNGDMERDFTYIDDIVDGIGRIIRNIPAGDARWQGSNPDPGSSPAPYRVYNIGNNKPEKLMRFIEVIEEALGMKASIRFLPMQPGDVKTTFADIEDLARDTGYVPATSIETGIRAFVQWFREYYRA
jgi:UDP-glucuronate 4-epimerase